MLYDQQWHEMVISHMDASPPVPVGQIFEREFGKPRTAAPLHVLASLYPEWEEMMKVTHSCAQLSVKPIFLCRGPMPDKDSISTGGWSNQESGLVFPPLVPGVVFRGVLGARDVYRNLLSKHFLKFGPKVSVNKLQFWRDDYEFKLDAVLAMKDAELTKVYTSILAQQFGKAQHLVLNAVGLKLLEELSGNPKSRLKALQQEDDKGLFTAAIRALMVYSVLAGETDPLVVEVAELVNSVTPELQLRFVVPLTATCRHVMNQYIKKLQN
jgi:hypothetical protein